MLRLFAYKNTTYKPASIVLMACAAFSVSSSSEKGRLPENQSLYKVITPPEPNRTVNTYCSWLRTA